MTDTPPTDHEREALAKLIWNAKRGVFSAPWEEASHERSEAYAYAGIVLAAGFRRRGPVTDAEVEAVANIMAESENTDSLETARAALEAARAVQ